MEQNGEGKLILELKNYVLKEIVHHGDRFPLIFLSFFSNLLSYGIKMFQLLIDEFENLIGIDY